MSISTSPAHTHTRRPILFCLAVFFLGAHGLLAQDGFSKIEAEQYSVTAEAVWRGKSTVAAFTIKNTGEAILEILGTRTSCSCATLEAPKTVAPGESAPLTVTVDTFKLSGQATINVFLQTNDPANPTTTLKVEVESKEVLAAHPGTYRYVVYQNFAGEALIPQTVLSTDDKDFKILDIESPYDFLTVTEPRAATEAERVRQFDGPQWFFQARLDNNPPVGALTGNIIVLTDHPDQPRIPIPISGFVRPLIVLTPDRLSLGTLKIPEGGTYVEVHMKQFAEEAIKIERIDSSVEGLEASTREVVPGREWKVRVLVKPSMKAGSFAGTLTIHTDHPRQKTVTLPVQGEIKAPSN